MEIFNTLLGIIGLVASLVALYFTYITFLNPIIRFRKYLRKADEWEKFIGTEVYISIYRHKRHPEFQITINWDNEVVSNFKEEWIMDYPWRDEDNNCSYYVRLEMNGMLLQTELFVGLDGHRYFVPVPKVQMLGDERYFYYNELQVQLAKIIGKYDFYKNIYEFVDRQKRLSINEYI